MLMQVTDLHVVGMVWGLVASLLGTKGGGSHQLQFAEQLQKALQPQFTHKKAHTHTHNANTHGLRSRLANARGIHKHTFTARWESIHAIAGGCNKFWLLPDCTHGARPCCYTTRSNDAPGLRCQGQLHTARTEVSDT